MIRSTSGDSFEELICFSHFNQNMSFVIGKYDMNEDKCSYTTDHQENKGTEVWPNSGTWKFNGQKGFRKAPSKKMDRRQSS